MLRRQDNKQLATSEQSTGRWSGLRTVLIYLLVGALWIALSDAAVSSLTSDRKALTLLQTYKGWFYVLATGLMLYALIRRDMLRIERSEQQRLESELRIAAEADAAKKDFYRGAIFSVTDGKLNLLTPEEARLLLPPCDARIDLDGQAALSQLRDAVGRTCREAGISGDREFMFVGAVGEAAANAIKHAGGGTASVGASDQEVRVCVEDNGPGLDALVLPKATLLHRFSTTTSMGLGYSLILQASDAVYLSTGPEGTSVLMELRIREPADAMSLDALPDTW